MIELTLYSAVGYVVIVAATVALSVAVWRLALSGVGRRGRVITTVAAAGAPLIWIGLGTSLVASEGRLYEPSVFLAVGFAVGVWTGTVIGRWEAVLLPLWVLLATVLFDAVREQPTTASGLVDPAPPLTIPAALLVVPALGLAVAGGVSWRRLGRRRRLDR